jgi:hypothetical protein
MDLKTARRLAKKYVQPMLREFTKELAMQRAEERDETYITEMLAYIELTSRGKVDDQVLDLGIQLLKEAGSREVALMARLREAK